MSSFDVIIPSSGRTDLLRRAIDSVPGWVNKIIVVRNGGQEETSMAVETSDKRVVVFYLDTVGNVSQARNYAIRASSAEFLLFLDDDDYYLSSFEDFDWRQLHFCDWIVAPVLQNYSGYSFFRPMGEIQSLRSVLAGSAFVGCTGWIIRRSLLKGVMFDERLELLEDLILGLELLSKNTPIVSSKPFYCANRENNFSLSTNVHKYARNLAYVREAYRSYYELCVMRAVANLRIRGGVRDLRLLQRFGVSVSNVDYLICTITSLIGGGNVVRLYSALAGRERTLSRDV